MGSAPVCELNRAEADTAGWGNDRLAAQVSASTGRSENGQPCLSAP
jgi:hypothetical protein